MQALLEMDAEMKPEERYPDGKCRAEGRFELPHLERVYTSAGLEAAVGNCGIKSLSWQQSAGYISTEYAYLYPPGIPLVVPGERISVEAVELLLEYQKIGFEIEGLKKDGEIEVWIDE